MKKISGIYKITSPTGRIYIGQSIDVHKRWKGYRRYGSKSQKKLHRSLKKHGADAHVFEVLHELPIDASKYVITRYEQLYMDLYSDCGLLMLNICTAAGSTFGRKANDSTKRKMSKARRKRVITEETGKRISLALKGVPKSNEHKEKLRIANLGYVVPEHVREKISKKHMGKFKKPHTDETKRLISESRKGRKLSEDHKEKISCSMKGKPGKPHSEETKEKIKAKRALQVSKPCTEKQKQQISQANKGAVRSPELRERISNSLKLFNKKRRHYVSK